MWNRIENDNDIKNLMEKYMGFHDSCIVSAAYSSGAKVDDNKCMSNGGSSEHTLSLIFNSQWCPPLELMFMGVRKCSIVGWQENYFCDIFDAYLAFNTGLLGKGRDDRLIVWADGVGFSPEKISEASLLGYTYVIAQEAMWKIKDL